MNFFVCEKHCMKSVHIRGYSGPYFPVYLVRMRENADQNNPEYGHFLRVSAVNYIFVKYFIMNAWQGSD